MHVFDDLLSHWLFPLYTRITVLAAICLTQAFMMWKFINFQLRRWREHAQAQTLKKKQVPSKSKSKKDKGDGNRGMGWRERENLGKSLEICNSKFKVTYFE